jgi:phage-related protein
VSGLGPVLWVGSSQRDLRRFPTAVRRMMGFPLYLAQHGQRHPNARPLIGFGGKRGAKTPLAEIALIKERLRRARAHHEGVEEP